MKSQARTVTTAAAAAAGAALLAMSCLNEATTPRQEARRLAPFDRVSAPGKGTDRYIVVLSDTVTNVGETARHLAAAHGGAIRHIYEYVLHGFSVTLAAHAIDVVRADPAVRYVQQVEAGKFRFGEHSTQYNPPWGLDRIDNRGGLNARHYYGETGSGVRIYIIDSGIRTAHAEFGGRASVGFDARPEDGRNGQDCHGHGTHVAGIAGGQTYGVAKSASLVAVKVNVACVDSIDPDDLLQGVNWVAGNHIKPAVANMSIQGPADTMLDRAVNEAVGFGVTFAVAAGNFFGANACNFSPARATQAITVGATTSTDARAGFSNVGTCLDIFAPGEGIPSAWATSNTATQTLSGTSQASPHVAGTVARFLQYIPTATPSYVASVISSRATQGVLTNIGTGSPNLLLYTFFDDASISGPSATETCTYTWFATASGVGSSFTYIWDKWLDTGLGTGGRWWQVGSGPSYCGSPGVRLRLTATDEFGFHKLAYY